MNWPEDYHKAETYAQQMVGMMDGEEIEVAWTALTLLLARLELMHNAPQESVNRLLAWMRRYERERRENAQR